ncbi:MAG: hypothetical protein KBI09_05775 [Mesotoga sp.]|nr:hypothetical protein [Mesotoga sp.]
MTVLLSSRFLVSELLDALSLVYRLFRNTFNPVSTNQQLYSVFDKR